MRERCRCGERNEMRNKQEYKVRERERERERESENVYKKILYVLENIIKKFAILEFSIP